jgi:hypothetical protein
VIEGDPIPPPAVWTIRNRRGVAVFATDDARHARMVADARAHGRPDPFYEDEEEP